MNMIPDICNVHAQNVETYAMGCYSARQMREETGRVLANLVQSCKTNDLHTFSIGMKYSLLNVLVNTVQPKGQEKLQIKTETLLSVVCPTEPQNLGKFNIKEPHTNSGGVQHMVYIEQTKSCCL
jgi:hypothetical protein